MKKAIILSVFLALGLFTQPLMAGEKNLESHSKSIAKGAAFLAKKQNENGSFGQFPGMKVKGDVGITGVSLMALAACPEEIRKKHKETIEKAVGYILKHQQKDGSFRNPGRGIANYQTSVSILALHRVDHQRFKTQINKAKKFLVQTQFSQDYMNVKPGDWNYGGWDYKPKKGKPDSDMSNVQFALEALKKAGLKKDSEVWKRATKFLSRCQNRSESNDMKGFVVLNDGGFMYYPGNSKAPVKKVKGGKAHPSYASMTYAGLKSFIYCNLDTSDPRVKAALGWIRRHYTLEENYGLGTRKNPKGGQQGLYYYYMTFAKALDAWDKDYITTADGQRHNWPKELAQQLQERQKDKGFWVNKNPRWWEGDPTLVTSYTLIAYNICYKRLKDQASKK